MTSDCRHYFVAVDWEALGLDGAALSERNDFAVERFEHAPGCCLLCGEVIDHPAQWDMSGGLDFGASTRFGELERDDPELAQELKLRVAVHLLAQPDLPPEMVQRIGDYLERRRERRTQPPGRTP